VRQDIISKVKAACSPATHEGVSSGATHSTGVIFGADFDLVRAVVGLDGPSEPWDMSTEKDMRLTATTSTSTKGPVTSGPGVQERKSTEARWSRDLKA
jgi:hypothetical protein